MNKQYFEGVLQLRNPTEEIVDFVANEIEKNTDVWIAKTKKQNNGIDLYISSNKFLTQIGKKLKANFSGQLTKSSSLYTRSKLTSKEVHRGCILFRHFDIKKGDTITVKGEEVKVISIGKDILGKTKDNKKVHIKFDQLRS
jgi:NMD protein affecting ribosome stability and mRNA decay